MRTTARTWLKTGAVGIAGLAAGGILATTVSATAEDAGGAAGDTAAQTDRPGDRQGPDEEALTGDTADSVREAVLAEYPGATVEWLETDSEGVYEAHVTTADGTRVTVAVDADFEVTGAQEGGPGHHGLGGPCGPGGPDRDDVPGSGTDDGVTQDTLATV